MGLFDSVFGKKKPIADLDRLQKELFAAARADDPRLLERLARANQAAVLEHFNSWQKVPEAIRADRAATQDYAKTLIAIAEVFDKKLGRSELMAALLGEPESNPLVRWQNVLGQAGEHISGLRYPEARALLSDALIHSRGMSGTGVDRYLPITYGYLAECHFHEGAADQAAPYLKQALALCEKSGDAEGVAAYLGSLFEVHRYLGQTEQAADCGDQAAAFFEAQKNSRDATRWRTRARISRAGEPRNRVVVVIDGATFELDEVQPVSHTHVKFNFERNRITLRPATVHTERGEQLGSDGRHEEALAAFREAAAADEFDPHSRLLGAFTLLYLERYADGVEAYRQVEELAPGWFHSRADLWVAKQLVLGRLDHSDFLALHRLEDGSEPPSEKVQLAVARPPTGTTTRIVALGKESGTRRPHSGRANSTASRTCGRAGPGRPHSTLTRAGHVD